ncbi:hypothetical protein L249_8280 [Ophiocordyceps polyrhachis-furcata BCC 54312]|uniref:Uncharacterized protein n=1 Tax=Ophiocordyceps polyrhachis-furcata BCC 54312 TaxID=1330021 RepID=A0A367LH76_9HYPO|nr:hypothetical protein L249_8280 [Ophiocordyceps polyrhachis-furcata BCC 54312]
MSIYIQQSSLLSLLLTLQRVSSLNPPLPRATSERKEKTTRNHNNHATDALLSQLNLRNDFGLASSCMQLDGDDEEAVHHPISSSLSPNLTALTKAFCIMLQASSSPSSARSPRKNDTK